MSLRFTLTLLALLTAGVAGEVSFGNHRRAKQISIPKFEYDVDTTRYCSWWIDNDGAWTCSRIESELEISMIDFQQWNPSIKLPCSTLPLRRSFCVAAGGTHYEIETVSGSPNTTETATKTATETLTARLTVTAKATPVESTPCPVESTVTTTVTETPPATTTTVSPTAETVTSLVPVTATKTTTFVVSVWSVVTATVTPPARTSTFIVTAWSGFTATVTAPAQTSTFIVTAWSGFTATVTAPAQVSTFIVTAWSVVTAATVTAPPSVSTLTKSTWSVITATVTPSPRTYTVTSTVTTTITPPTRVTTVTATRVVTSTVTPAVGRNGIPTPVPFQPEMVGNCQTFYFVRRGDTCESIGARHRLAPEQIVAWNPGARRDCTMLLADYYCCVGVA